MFSSIVGREGATAAAVYAARASSAQMLGQHVRAVYDLTKAIGLEPNNATHLASRASSFAALGQIASAPGALLDYDAILQLMQRVDGGATSDFTSGDVLLARGLAREKVKQYDGAVEDYTIVLDAIRAIDEDRNGSEASESSMRDASSGAYQRSSRRSSSASIATAAMASAAPIAPADLAAVARYLGSSCAARNTGTNDTDSVPSPLRSPPRKMLKATPSAGGSAAAVRSGSVGRECSSGGSADSRTETSAKAAALLFQRSVCLRKLRRMEEAVEDLREVVTREPKVTFYQMELASVLRDNGELSGAEEIERQAKSQWPHANRLVRPNDPAPPQLARGAALWHRPEAPALQRTCWVCEGVLGRRALCMRMSPSASSSECSSRSPSRALRAAVRSSPSPRCSPLSSHSAR